MAEKHIYIVGIVGKDVTLSKVIAETKGLGANDKIVAHIHSEGGEVEEGYAIYSYLVNTGAVIETRIEGLCASIATVIAQAGNKGMRYITEYSKTFVHMPWGEAKGNSDYLINYASNLRTEEEKLANFYVDKTSQPKDAIIELMKSETSLSAQQSVELGFADEVITSIKAVAYIELTPNQNKPDSFMNKLTESINATITAAMAKFGIKAQAEPVKASIETTLEDGTAVTIESESEVPTVGDMVTLADGSPAPDGEHTLADGTMITTEAGAITAVTPPAAASAEEQIAALQASIAEKDATIAALQTENAEFQNSIKTAQHVITEMQAKLESKVVLPTRTQNFNHRKQEPAPKSFTTAAILENAKKASAKK